MSKSVILSLLAQGNTATEILTILDMLVESIVEENIDDVAEYYAALQIVTVCPLDDSGGHDLVFVIDSKTTAFYGGC